MDFHVEAVWDNAARAFRSEGNIAGLHIEAETLAEFREVLSDVAPELIMANHVSRDDLLASPSRNSSQPFGAARKAISHYA